MLEDIPATDRARFRKSLLRWYDRAHRLLPWRENGANGRPAPWRVLVSEIMLQQTRVEAVLPFFHRFLARFPDAASLAAASEADALALWSGLGYYSRIRNLRRAAAEIAANGFPDSYAGIRGLPGVGPYTAAAIGSIAFGLPYAVADGNVFRVVARYGADGSNIASDTTRRKFTVIAQTLLDPRRPGDFNQAIMELGATVCLPRNPLCLLCPVASGCRARMEARQHEFPVKKPKPLPKRAEVTVVVARRGNQILLQQRGAGERRLAKFWELPHAKQFPGGLAGKPHARFAHTIVNTRYTVAVQVIEDAERPDGTEWFPLQQLNEIPLTTLSRKALARVYPIGVIAGRSSASV